MSTGTPGKVILLKILNDVEGEKRLKVTFQMVI